MEESARIVRGVIKDISDLNAAHYDALFLPGGFGVAKNFSDFATKGPDMTVQEDVEKVLKDFQANKKYIGFCCISPIVAARVFGKKFGGPGLILTLGKKGENWPYAGSIEVATSFGNELAEKDISEICIDEKNKIISTPAYMKDNANPYEILSGIDKLVAEVA